MDSYDPEWISVRSTNPIKREALPLPSRDRGKFVKGISLNFVVDLNAGKISPKSFRRVHELDVAIPCFMISMIEIHSRRSLAAQDARMVPEDSGTCFESEEKKRMAK